MIVHWWPVRCGDHAHRVGLSKKGRLVLLDHPDPLRLDVLKTMRAFGDMTCGCLAFIEEWTRHIAGEAPWPQLFDGHPHLWNAIQKHYARSASRAQRPSQYPTYPSSSPQEWTFAQPLTWTWTTTTTNETITSSMSPLTSQTLWTISADNVSSTQSSRQAQKNSAQSVAAEL